MNDETRRLLARLLDLAEHQTHRARPTFRPLRYYVRRNPHRTLMRFAHDRPRCVGTN